MNCHQDVSLSHLHAVLLERRDDVSWRRNDDVPSVRFHDISNKSQMKHPATLSGTSPRMECIHNVPLVRLCNISSNFQMKHPITWPWYVFTTSQNYIVATPSLYYVLYYVFKLLGHEIHLLDFHISSKYQIKHQIFLLQIRRKTRGVVWIIN